MDEPAATPIELEEQDTDAVPKGDEPAAHLASDVSDAEQTGQQAQSFPPVDLKAQVQQAKQLADQGMVMTF